MSEFNLNRFRYNWKGDWVTGTAYNRDDIVKVGGKTDVCLVTHTANASFNVDLTATLPGSNPSVPQPKWVVMTESTTYKGAWQSATEYFPADIVLKDAVLPANTSLRAINGGEKLVLPENNALYVSSSVDDSVDVILSYVEIT